MGWLSAGLAVGGALLGAKAQADAGKKQRRAAALQGEFTYDTRLEEIRRQRIQQTYVESLTRARIAASGVESGGSPQLYENFLSKENSRQIRWARDAANKERKAIEAGAPGKADTKLAAAGELLSGISSAIGLYNS